MGQYFIGVDQEFIERRQTEFMSKGMGGPTDYDGIYPVPAHQHMFIPRELFKLRLALKEEALREADIPQTEAAEWLAIDKSFEEALVKTSVRECEKRDPDDEIVIIPRPTNVDS